MPTTVDNGALTDIPVATGTHPQGGVFERQPQASTASYGSVTVTTSATLVRSANTARIVATLRPTDGDVFLGYDSSVTALTGYPVYATETFEERDTTTTLYMISASGSVNVRWTDITAA